MLVLVFCSLPAPSLLHHLTVCQVSLRVLFPLYDTHGFYTFLSSPHTPTCRVIITVNRSVSRPSREMEQVPGTHGYNYLQLATDNWVPKYDAGGGVVWFNSLGFGEKEEDTRDSCYSRDLDTKQLSLNPKLPGQTRPITGCWV